MTTPYVTRVAPSPTGLFHIGTARTAYQNWLAARASGGKFILRIDDTDAARNDDAYVDVILDAMKWLGLDYDEVHRQSDRAAIYDDVAMSLFACDLAYHDPADRDADGRMPLRLRLPDDLPLTWDDRASGSPRPTIVRVSDAHRKDVDGLILVRSDGTPTYHFASVIDDLLMGVNFVIRGADHLNNTIKQIAIASALRKMQAFGIDGDDLVLADAFENRWRIPAFAHVGLIEVLDPDTGKRKKMSKRDDAASLLGYRDAGYDPDAMLDYVLSLGWAATDGDFNRKHKMVTRDVALATFLTGGHMRSSPSLFDPVKLDSLNRRYKAAKEMAAKEARDV